MTKVKRQKRKVGDVLCINLEDGSHAYARVLDEATFAVYDLRTMREPSVEEIIACPILFRVAVMDWAVTKRRWVIIGQEPLDGTLVHLPPKFIQDTINKSQFSIYENGSIRPASRAECIGLECAAIWDPSHVEDRILDHYAGRPNKWLESLKIKD
jgi:hypothetical protein